MSGFCQRLLTPDECQYTIYKISTIISREQEKELSEMSDGNEQQGRDVMHPQAPEGVFHGPGFAQLHPFLMHGEDTSKGTGGEVVPDELNGWFVEQQMPYHEDPARGFGCINQILSLA